MREYNKVIVNKNFMKKLFRDKEKVYKSLSRFIDNSIKFKKGISKDDPCKVEIKIFENLITITDNSGGIDSKITDKEIFMIGVNNKDEVSGLGIKKSLFELGNKIDIISNNKISSKKFTLDLNLNDNEMISYYEDIKYNYNEVEGTTIFISDLEKNVKEEIVTNIFLSYTIEKLGRLYSKFITKGNLILKIDSYIVKPNHITAQKIASSVLLDKYNVDLYKSTNNEISGVDLFINDFMIYDREKKDRSLKWNLLSESKYRLKDCIVEIRFNGERDIYESEKDNLYLELRKFIKENKSYFKSKTMIIQYDMDIDKIEELKEYYDENTAKAIGIIAFNKLHEDYIARNATHI